jgi:hypothetical protein
VLTAGTNWLERRIANRTRRAGVPDVRVQEGV